MKSITNYFRYLLLLLLCVIGFTLGYMRWTYAVIWDSGFKLIPRKVLYSQYIYPFSWDSLLDSLLRDPRWVSAIFYFVVPFLFSLASIYLFFLRKDYVIKTIWVYVVSWGFLAFISSLSIIFSNYSIGIGIAQNLKHLLQTPFFSLLLIASFRTNEVIRNI